MSEVVRFITADTECEVLVEGEWCFGVVAEWRLDSNDVWWAWARVAAPDGNRILVAPESVVREPQIDWSRGRGP